MENLHYESSFASQRMKRNGVSKIDPLFEHSRKLQKRNSLLEHVIRQMDADNEVLRKRNKQLKTPLLESIYRSINDKLRFMWATRKSHKYKTNIVYDTRIDMFADKHSIDCECGYCKRKIR